MKVIPERRRTPIIRFLRLYCYHCCYYFYVYIVITAVIIFTFILLSLLLLFLRLYCYHCCYYFYVYIVITAVITSGAYHRPIISASDWQGLLDIFMLSINSF
jgi:hypothetical protein